MKTIINKIKNFLKSDKIVTYICTTCGWQTQKTKTTDKLKAQCNCGCNCDK